MPIEISERNISREVRYGTTGGSEVLLFTATGSADQVAVYAAVVAGTPAVWDGFVRREIRLRPVGDDDRWDVEVEYGSVGQDGTLDPVGTDPSTPSGPSSSLEPLRGGYSFDLTADTIHVTQSRRTIGRVQAGGPVGGGATLAVIGAANTVNPAPFTVEAEHFGQTVWIIGGPAAWALGGYVITGVDVVNNLWTLDRPPAAVGSINGVWTMLPQGPDYRGAIGVSDERIEGCDIFGPRFEWSRTVSLPFVTRAYLMTLRNLTGRKNAAAFYGARPGEVLYLGATGNYSQGERWSVTHKFSEIANQENLEIRPGLVVPYKRGWDYLWVRYTPEVVDGQILHRAAAAYVEDVIPDGDFALIGIGV